MRINMVIGLKTVLTNGIIPLIPLLVWNIILTGKLPSAYRPESFDKGVPLIVKILEQVFRSIVFIFPLFLKINIYSFPGRIGLILYIAGSVTYFSSWIIQIRIPESRWSQSIWGFAAPAYLPLIWFIGMALMFETYYFNFITDFLRSVNFGLTYSPLQYIVPAILFSFVHILHSVIAHRKSV